MRMRCKYPSCTVAAKKTWALVPLCDGHHDTIKTETILYYKKGISGRDADRSKRHHYAQIEHLTPWGQNKLRRWAK